MHGLGNPLAQLCAVLHFSAANHPRAKAVQCSEPMWGGHIELSTKPTELLRTGAGPAFARTVLKRSRGVPVVRKIDIVHIGPPQRERRMDELNGKLIACQILITGLIARVTSKPLRFRRADVHAALDNLLMKVKAPKQKFPRLVRRTRKSQTQRSAA